MKRFKMRIFESFSCRKNSNTQKVTNKISSRYTSRSRHRNRGFMKFYILLVFLLTFGYRTSLKVIKI